MFRLFFSVFFSFATIMVNKDVYYLFKKLR